MDGKEHVNNDNADDAKSPHVIHVSTDEYREVSRATDDGCPLGEIEYVIEIKRNRKQGPTKSESTISPKQN